MSPIWVFGYGSLIWNPGFAYDARVVGFVRDYRRVFYQGSTDHRGTPEFPGRTVTLEHQPGATCWGAAYRIKDEDKEIAMEYLEVREKQYDEKVYLDLYTDSSPKVPAVENVMVYFATANKETNQNYLGPAPLEEMARQIYLAQGPSGPNKEYLFKLEDALNKLGVVDEHVQELANVVRSNLDRFENVAVKGCCYAGGMENSLSSKAKAGVRREIALFKGNNDEAAKSLWDGSTFDCWDKYMMEEAHNWRNIAVPSEVMKKLSAAGAKELGGSGMAWFRLPVFKE